MAWEKKRKSPAFLRNDLSSNRWLLLLVWLNQKINQPGPVLVIPSSISNSTPSQVTFYTRCRQDNLAICLAWPSTWVHFLSFPVLPECRVHSPVCAKLKPCWPGTHTPLAISSGRSTRADRAGLFDSSSVSAETLWSLGWLALNLLPLALLNPLTSSWQTQGILACACVCACYISVFLVSTWTWATRRWWRPSRHERKPFYLRLKVMG